MIKLVLILVFLYILNVKQNCVIKNFVQNVALIKKTVFSIVYRQWNLKIASRKIAKNAVKALIYVKTNAINYKMIKITKINNSSILYKYPKLKKIKIII